MAWTAKKGRRVKYYDSTLAQGRRVNRATITDASAAPALNLEIGIGPNHRVVVAAPKSTVRGTTGWYLSNRFRT